MDKYEDLKNLHYEDFAAPNKVLCYGGGGAFEGVAKYMFKCGINIKGIIDANKTGIKEYNSYKIPYYNIEQAESKFGHDIILIITIANEDVIEQVRADLIRLGFNADKIYDMNVWTWLMVPSEKSYCRNIGGYFQFFQSALSNCCNNGAVIPYLSEWFIEKRDIKNSVHNYLEKRAFYIEQSDHKMIPAYCSNCPFLTENNNDKCDRIEKYIISDHAVCNADCVYCGDSCSEHKPTQVHSLKERYTAIIESLDYMNKKDLIDKSAVFQLAGGEITINPQKMALYEAVRKYPELSMEFLSNCFIYDEELAKLLKSHKNSFLQCDLDAGTPETYIKVKGFNKYETVKNNLNEYSKYGEVRLKYVVLPGFNDSEEDYDGAVCLLKELNLNTIALSPEFNVGLYGNKTQKREMLFSAARFIVKLTNAGIQYSLSEVFWKKSDIDILNRVSHELMQLTL